MTPEATGLEIAVIGMDGRFPGAATLADFWANLRAGRESVRVFTSAELTATGVDPRVAADPRYVPAQAVLDGVDRFDAGFFGMTPAEAARTDPQQRLLLECAWTAMERAGHVPGDPAEAVGVYVGVGFPQYLRVLAEAGLLAVDDERQVALAIDKDHAATRIAYKLGLRGPGIGVQTACSSSLVAVHLACQALLAGDCELALAGGMTVRLPPRAGYLRAEGGVDSADGHCRPYDADASGMVRGSGGGLVLLRPLADALAGGDQVLAVIRGSAVTNDGHQKVGYAAPGVAGQTGAIRAAQTAAGVTPAEVSYVEGHGTGTPLGDPVEVAALTAAFAGGPARAVPCGLGSVKANIGHLDTGSGIAGLIKTVLALQNDELPPSINYARPNAGIDFTAGPFEVVSTLRRWPREDGPRVAGVSSFGIGGTNAHVVLADPPPPVASVADGGPHLLALSARSAAELDELTARLADQLADEEIELADAAYTLQLGRRPFGHRRTVVVADRPAAIAALRSPPPARERAAAPVLAFLFPGQASAQAGDTSGLHRAEPAFRAVVDECADLLGGPPGAGTQPAVFVEQYALARLWQSRGVRPQVVLGHSLGEYAAACLAGVLDLPDALLLLATRDALMAGLPRGAMAEVACGEAALTDLDRRGLSLAAVNGPDRCVVSGPEPAVAELLAVLAGRGVAARRLPTDRAFHSGMTEPILADFRAAVRQVRLSAPAGRWLSTVTGDWVDADRAGDPEHWVRHLRGMVRFEAALGALDSAGRSVTLELGAGGVLTGLVRRALPAATAVRSLDPARPATTALLAAAGELWAAGVDQDWTRLHPRPRRRVALPTYPFRGERHWLEPAADREPDSAAGPATPPDLSRSDPNRWCHLPYWRPAGPVGSTTSAASGDRWLVVAGRPIPGLADRLAGTGPVSVVAPGADYAAALEATAGSPSHVVYVAAARSWVDVPTAAEELFGDLLALARALAGVPHPVRLTVVTTGAQPVVPGEPIELAQAPLLGLALVLPQESPSVRCRVVDMPPSAEPDMAALLAELARPDPLPPVVALRHGRPWRPDAVAVPLPAPAGAVGLRRGGVYVITGGLGAVGLEVAEFLARTCGARLVLTSRREFPAVERWSEVLAGGVAETGSAADSDSSRDRLTALEGPRPDRSESRSASAMLSRLAAQQVREMLAAHGLDTRPGALLGEGDLLRRLDVRPGYRRFARSMLAVLVEERLADRSGSGIRFRDGSDPAAGPADRLRAEHPDLGPLLDLLARCVDAAPDVMAGRREAVEVLFPEGSVAPLDEVTRLIGRYSDQDHYLSVLAEMVRQRARRAARRSLRVLEIGAGKGRLTDLLAPLGLDYTITDISPAFVEAARDRYGHLPGLRFGVLDVIADPAAQGFDAGSFDLVVGFNVVHAAPHLGGALTALQAILAPGGTLALVETVTDERWARLIWGLTREWWAWTDLDVRSDSPLVDVPTWLAALTTAGYVSVDALPAGDDRPDTALLVGRRPAGEVDRVARTIRRLRAIEAAGGAVLVRRADVTDRAAMSALATEVERIHGRIDGVLHLAVEGGGSLIPSTTAEAVHAEFGPKVRGAVVLDEVFRDRDLDFLLLFSSLTGLLGGYGAAAYAGASAFVDRFAHAVHGRPGSPVVTVTSALWKGLGTAVSAGARRHALGGDLDRLGMTPAEGVAVLHRVLASRPGPQVIVSPADLGGLLEHADHRLRSPAGRPAAPAATAATLPGIVAGVWQEVFGLLDIDPDADFTALGGDSLIAVQIVSRLRDVADLRLPLRALFAAPTINGNVAALSGVPLPARATASGPDEAEPAGADPVLDALLIDIEGMSEDEVRRALAAERPERTADEHVG